jgi:hypothetical protein
MTVYFLATDGNKSANTSGSEGRRRSLERERAMEKRTCPACGEEYDPKDYEVVECPRCGKSGSTKCCCPGGNGCICVECEERPDDEQ